MLYYTKKHIVIRHFAQWFYKSKLTVFYIKSFMICSFSIVKSIFTLPFYRKIKKSDDFNPFFFKKNLHLIN